MPRNRKGPLATFAMQALPAVFCFVILFSAAAAAAVAAAQPVAITPEKRAQFEVVIARFMAANRIPGVSVAVVASRGRARFL
jgi:hypothetical protein